jgi:glycosyltransferase involved in cell wall biosynthesis
MTHPRVVIGIPLYSDGTHLREALESLLVQDYRDFRIVATDDGSSAEAKAVMREYQAHDDRLDYARNDRRLGMVGNWRAAFESSRRAYPSAEYFAWGSDHDVWHPHWLGTLVKELDADPCLVAAYPRTHGIDEMGRPLLPGAHQGFETAGIRDPTRRLRSAVAGMAAGNLIYALIRIDALTDCGVFPSVLLPDRFFLAKLAIRGEFREIPRTLWYRRFRAGVRPSLSRQRRSFFPDGVPLYARLPWWVTHSVAMAKALVVRREAAVSSRHRGILLTLVYIDATLRLHFGLRWHSVAREMRHAKKRVRRDSRRAVKTIRHRLHRARLHLRVRLSRLDQLPVPTTRRRSP